MSNTPKTKLPYLLQEALTTGNWNLETVGKNSETWIREGEQVTIGHKLLNGTNPASVVFQWVTTEGSEHGLDVINSLCARLSKRK